MGTKKPLDKITLMDVPVKDIEFAGQEPARSEQLLEFVRVASLQCVDALLRIRPIVVVPLSRGKWKILAGQGSFLIAKAFGQLSDTVPVVAVPGEGDAANVIPIVDALFSHLLNTSAPVEDAWDKYAKDPAFGALGRDLTHPKVRGMLASKKVLRKYDRTKSQDATGEQPAAAPDTDPTAPAQPPKEPGTAPGGTPPEAISTIKRPRERKNPPPDSAGATAEQQAGVPNIGIDQSRSAGDASGDQDARPMPASERGNPNSPAPQPEATTADPGQPTPDAVPAQGPSPS